MQAFLDVVTDPFVVVSLSAAIPTLIVYFWALFTGRLDGSSGSRKKSKRGGD